MKKFSPITRFTMIQLLTFIVWALVVTQIIIIGWMNVTQLQNHMGFDASSYFLKASEMWKQGTPFIGNWNDQTTLYLDSSVPIAALLMNIFNNIFVSYGMANNIVVILIITALYSVLSKFEISVLSKGIGLALVLCPYLGIDFANSNDIGYFSSTLISGNWYGVKVFLTLLFISCFISLKSNRKNYILCLLTCILYFVSGLSSGYYLAVTVIIPIIICGIIEMFYKDKASVLLDKSMLFSYLNLILIVLGKIFAVKILGFVSRDSNQVWVGLEGFWRNLGSILLGYMGLLEAQPENAGQLVLTASGVSFCLGAGILVITIIALIFVFRSMLHNFERERLVLIPIVIIFFNIIMFSFINTTYAEKFFEERYLIIPYFMIIICLCIWIDSLHNNLFKRLGCVLLVILVLGCTVKSDMIYINNRVRLEQYQKVKDEVAKFETPVVYVYGEKMNIFVRNIRVFDLNKIYKNLTFYKDGGDPGIVHWGDYTYYDYKSEWNNEILLITTENDLKNISEKYKNQFQEEYRDKDFVLLKSKSNVFGMD